METVKRLPGLDGLRAIFCVGIVLYHVNSIFHSVFLGLLRPVYAFGGYFGNYAFFIISGLLTAFHYRKELLENHCRFRPFIRKQIFKIYPLYLLSNVVVMLLPGREITLGQTLATACLMAGGKPYVPYNQPAWFLCVLMFCYLLYYLTGTLSRRHSGLYLPLCGFFMLGGMLLMKLAWNIPFLSCTYGEGYFNFFLGVLFWEAVRSPAIGRKKVLAAACTILSVAAVCIAYFGLADTPGEMRWNITIICLSFICLALYAKPLTKLLEVPPLRALGTCSFSVYLWHVPFAMWFLLLERRLGLRIIDQRPNLILYLVLLMELSIVSHHILERKRRALP